MCWKLLETKKQLLKFLTASKSKAAPHHSFNFWGFESLHPHNLILWVSVSYLIALLLDTPGLETKSQLLAIIKLIAPVEKAIYPFRKARLYIPGQNAKRKEWYIQYWAWDILNKKLKKFSDFEVNSLKGSDQSKKSWAKRRCAQINRLLEDGYHYNPIKQKYLQEKEKFIQSKATLPVGDLLDNFLLSIEKKSNFGERIKTNYHLNGYKSKSEKFSDWISAQNLSGLTADLFTSHHITTFLDHLILERKLSMRTRDNYLSFLRAFFNWCSSEDIPNQNPCKGITKQNKKLGRNIAYSNDQQKELLDWMEIHRPDFHFLCLFIYYTFIRIEEMALLKIENINQFQDGVIRIPEEVSKTGFLRNVTIPEQLQDLIQQKGILNHPGSHYIFSNDFSPGPSYYPSKYFGNRYGKVIRPKFDWMQNDHTLYSWKHTGIVALKKSGMRDAFIMMQSGHRTISAYQTYLKSLGLEKNEEISSSFPSPG